MPHDSHESLAKAMFSRVEYAAAEFRYALPPAVVEQLDLDALKLCPGSFVSDELRKQHTDLLYSVPLDGEEAFIYLLLEHQSKVDKLMPYRLWQYVGAIWEWYLADHEGATTLPVVIPVVLHHSEKGWTAPTSIGELFALNDEVRSTLGEYLPALRLVLDDLSTQADDELRSRAMSAVPKLALWALKNARHAPDLVALLHDWVEVVRQVATAPNGVRALAMILRYILDHSDTDPTVLRSFLVNTAGEQAREAFMTGAEKLRQEGREQGRDEALRDMLFELLSQRFGDLPEQTRQRIEQADPDDVKRWTRRVIPAATLGDVFE